MCLLSKDAPWRFYECAMLQSLRSLNKVTELTSHIVSGITFWIEQIQTQPRVGRPYATRIYRPSRSSRMLLGATLCDCERYWACGANSVVMKTRVVSLQSESANRAPGNFDRLCFRSNVAAVITQRLIIPQSPKRNQCSHPPPCQNIANGQLE
jgi:hypothetical protein